MKINLPGGIQLAIDISSLLDHFLSHPLIGCEEYFKQKLLSVYELGEWRHVIELLTAPDVHKVTESHIKLENAAVWTKLRHKDRIGIDLE
eukprot:CAMPEP_0115031986 /NCGR_PEP_ID=MMETSP0216-20121206/38885_1 /TAXON_ID=223996 /ORGANISM="Protocruzia adherens, Strain Boccale" /LENGTH=89 /DNA_ID=CAMNT_0002409791 /DNA_START=913 /DNA_END=1179 /DNA_ORIENTATION=+